MINHLDPKKLGQAASEQRKASDPNYSVFVSASAGSGKTKILIDRILRLMLPSRMEVNGEPVTIAPTPPERILCLTYTKAAAAEMMERLRRELASWFQLSDVELSKKLEGFGITPTQDVLHEARALLGKVLEAPGGMKIQTIHSFCQSLLQRFPAESGLVPNFELIDDLTQDAHLQEGLDETLEECSSEDFRALVDRYEPASVTENIFKLCKSISSDTDLNVDDLASSFRDIDLYKNTQSGEFKASVGRAFDWLLSAMQPVTNLTEPQERKFVEIREAANLFRKDASCDWTFPFLIKTGERNKWGPEKVLAQSPDLSDALSNIKDLAEPAKQVINYEQNLPFLTLFAMLTLKTLKRSNDLKSAFQHVTYADLLLRTRNLLKGIEEAWVRYKLDGGIDHILLDEVQDNSKLQWEIVHSLTDEFFENTDEANQKPRTIFAVGDFKQSIYGFQGAEPDEFFNEKEMLQRKAEAARCSYVAPELKFSFRTHQPLLDFVNQVFAEREDQVGMDNFINHESVKVSQSGRVEVWPLVESEVEQDSDEDADDGEDSATFRAAIKISDFIAQQLHHPKKWLTGQSLKPKDIMVLTRKRGNPDFLALLESLLKRRGIPTVNGARFDFKKHIAVQDLMSLCRALLLPSDNMSVAKVLVSPLGGLTHDSLMDLILENGKLSTLDTGSFDSETLWEILARRAPTSDRKDWKDAHEILTELWQKADYESPYMLLSRALGQCHGYERYCARFGKEIYEILDAFLNFALEFDTSNVSSLEGFIDWMETENLEIKREDLKTSNAVQLMTVHAAKGLESKMVILADIPGDKNKERHVWMTNNSGLQLPAVLSLVKDSEGVKALAEEQKLKEQAELDRLLYVALTRASEWFVCMGWKNKKDKESGKDEEQNQEKDDAPVRWNERCRRALRVLKDQGDERVSYEHVSGEERLVLNGDNQASPLVEKRLETTAEKATLPSWLDHMSEVLKPEKASSRPLRPSRPEGAEFGARPFSFSPITPKTQEGISPRERGILVHKLLQLLPDIEVSERDAFTKRWAERNMTQIKAGERQRIIQNCLSVLEDKTLTPLFSKEASVEQPVSGFINENPVLGKIDRVYMGENDIWVADYKTGRPPAHGKDTPETYLRQMRTYAQILKNIKPGATLHAFIIWTQNAEAVDISKSL